MVFFLDGVLPVISLLMSGGGFLAGIKKFFNREYPLYFQLIICAIGCYALQDLFVLISVICEYSYDVSPISVMTSLGCFCFVLSANYGQIDRMVDDKRNRKQRLIAMIAPIVMTIIILYAYIEGRKHWPVAQCMLTTIGYIPSIPASYYCLKHLIIPMDDFGFLSATKYCNIVALFLFVIEAYYLIFMTVGNILSIYIASALTSAGLGMMYFACDKGVKVWKSLL